jgi:Asp-tRNA(Asn)/Glu-tRNA(Gln) amidotransferase A subunit family amidase
MKTAPIVLMLTLSAPAIAPLAAQDIDVVELTIGEIHAAFHDGDYTAEQLTQAFLDRIGTYEPAYNAFTFLNPMALEDARAIDRRRAAGEALGRLAGIPVVIKEAMDVAGLPSTAGWAAMAGPAGGIDFVPSTDAPVVARLREAGAIILGKTNIPAFSAAYNANNSWAGPTFSAIGLEFSPGGSSAGSATAVAGSFAVLATAEDTVGSIQAPAGVQGIVGVKPTFGLVPSTGVAPLGASLRDVIGPFARTVRDAAIMLDVMAGYTPEDPKTVLAIGNTPAGGYTSLLSETALEGVRVGLFGPGFRDAALTDETAMLYRQAIAEIEALGAVTIEDPFAGSGFVEIAGGAMSGLESFAYDFDRYLARMGPDVPARSLAELRALLPAEAFSGPFASQLADADDPVAVPDLSAFVASREAHLTRFASVMDAHDLDVLVFPHDMRGTPLRVGGGPGAGHQVTATPVINIAGLPGVVVPAGAYEIGMPFSLIFVGRLWSEAELLAYVYAYEQATHHRIVPELIAAEPTAVE